MSSSPNPMRDAFIDRLFDLGRADRDVVFISADFGAPSLDRFREKLPGQFIHSGISEQHMIDMAGGLAIAGCGLPHAPGLLSRNRSALKPATLRMSSSESSSFSRSLRPVA